MAAMTEAPHTPRRRATVASVFGELLLTVGVLMLLFAFYESYWTNLASAKQQEEVSAQMDEQWTNPRVKHELQLGEAFARLYIPAFGSDFHFAIVEGTDEEDLLKGPGRYVDTQMPGQPGNFAVAGHRVGKGAPFNDLGNLKSCDAIVVETQTSWEIYRMLPVDGDRAQQVQCLTPEQQGRVLTGDYADVQGRIITLPDDVGVIYPHPGIDIAANDTMEPLLTLTTCHPQFSNAERMIVHAMLVRSEPKHGDYRPAELETN